MIFPALLLLEVRYHRTDAEKDALEVDVDGPVPGLHRDVLESHRLLLWRHELDSSGAGGTDQDVQPAQLLESGADQGLALAFVGHIRLHGDRLSAQILDLGCHLSRQVLLDVADHHVGARPGQA